MKNKKILFLFLLAFIWVCIGFSTGIGVLLGPVRFTTSFLREIKMDQSIEKWAIRLIILIYVCITFCISLWLTTRFKKMSSSLDKSLFIVVLILITTGSVYLMMKPTWLGLDRGTEKSLGSRFTFGPYPSKERLLKLKKEGYTGVISLLHKLVIPFEPKLLADEKKLAAEIGIPVIHLPFLPWIGKNEESMNKLADITKKGTGKYYIHCYLGKDRVRIAERVIKLNAKGNDKILGITKRTIRYLPWKMERGFRISLGDIGDFIPYPSEEEWLLIIGSNRYKTIISLLDPKNTDDEIWLNKEKEKVKRFGLPWINIPLSPDKINADALQSLPEKIKFLPKPILFHSYKTNTSRAIAFLDILQLQKIPINNIDAFSVLSNSTDIDVLGAEVAISGNNNSFPTIGTLNQLGINDVIFYGNENLPEMKKLRDSVIKGKINWHLYENWESLLLGNQNKGPFILLGPWPSEVIRRIRLSVIPLNSDHNFKFQSAKKVFHSKEEIIVPSRFHWFMQFVPEPRMILLISPLLFLWIWIASSIASWLKIVKKLKTGYSRKAFHFLIITSASVLQVAYGLKAVSILGGYCALWVCYATWRGKGFPFFEALARPKDEPRRGLFVILPLFTTALGGILSNLFFGKFAVIGYLVCGWGDGIGEVAGTLYGKHPYTVPGLAGVPANRSLEGSAAVGIVGSIAAFIGFVTLGVSMKLAIPVALTCGVIGMIVEAFSNHGLDNLTLQLAASAIAFLLIV